MAEPDGVPQEAWIRLGAVQEIVRTPLLAKNVDKVLTHTFITREIWGTSWDSDLASLRVFMRTLRKKIEADPSHPKMIQTHMGVGYRMQRL